MRCPTGRGLYFNGSLSSRQFCDSSACEHVKPPPAIPLAQGRTRPPRTPKGKHPPKVQSTRLKDLAVRVWFSMALRVLPGALRKGRRRRGPLLIPNESHPGRRGNVAIVLSRPCSFLPARYARQWKANVPRMSQPNGASVGRQCALAGRDPNSGRCFSSPRILLWGNGPLGH